MGQKIDENRLVRRVLSIHRELWNGIHDDLDDWVLETRFYMIRAFRKGVNEITEMKAKDYRGYLERLDRFILEYYLD